MKYGKSLLVVLTLGIMMLFSSCYVTTPVRGHRPPPPRHGNHYRQDPPQRPGNHYNKGYNKHHNNGRYNNSYRR